MQNASTYNADAVARAKEQLGERYCLHPNFNNPQAVTKSGESILSRWLREHKAAQQAEL